MNNGIRAAFVDRDGVVNELVPDPETGLPESPTSVDQVQLLPGAASALRELAAAGFAVVCVTNQPAAAKGKTSMAELVRINERVESLLADEGARFDLLEMCVHHPDGVVPELTRACDCRKPEPGMLLRAASARGLDLAESWMIGDSDSDIEAGARAGCRTILVLNPKSSHRRGGAGRADASATTLAEAVSYVLSRPPTASVRG